MSTPGTILQRFFVTGGTLPRDAACYIRREADERLYSSLRRGDICYALTPRQMGKSSLMVQTAALLREKKFSVALLDLTAFGQNLTPDQWYNGLVGRIGQQLDLEDELEDYWNDHLALGPLQRWSGAIREVVLAKRTGPIVIFIDEIDAIRSLPFSTDEFFAGIREFYNRRTLDPELSRLTFCLLGVATPSDLIRDTRTTPFNVGVRVELSDFTPEEAAPLAQGLCTDVAKCQELVRRVLYWTGGHPYLTQRLCQAISLDCAATPVSVDRACNELFLSHRAREKDDNLLFVRERMLRNEADLAGLLLLYGKVRSGARVRDDERNPLVTILRLAGIVRVEGGCLKVRNRIYSEVFNKDWVAENLPGAELRRQKAAYFRGFKIAGAIFGSLLLLAGAYDIQRLYQPDTTPPPPRVKEKPAFWASFTSRALQTNEGGSLVIEIASQPLKVGREGISVKGMGIEDVSVFINGAQYGRTDREGTLRIPVLPEGDYQVRLEKLGFASLDEPNVQIQARQETEIMATLAPKSQVVVQENRLVISGAPSGTGVSVDGRSVGVTNAGGELTVRVEPGDHEILLEKAGYVSRDFKERLNSGNNPVDGKLQPDHESADLAAALASGDLSQLQRFLNQYPQSKSISQVRARMEDLDWAKTRSTNDPMVLQAFMDRYANGQHSADAKRLSELLTTDEMDWRAAQTSNTLESLQNFARNHAGSRHLPDANGMIGALTDRRDIAALLQAYQDSYNRQDLNRFLQLWPTAPAYVQTLFKQKRSGTLSLSANGLPAVRGDAASQKVAITHETSNGGGSSLTVALFLFKRQNDHWVVETGSL